ERSADPELLDSYAPAQKQNLNKVVDTVSGDKNVTFRSISPDDRELKQYWDRRAAAPSRCESSRGPARQRLQIPKYLN
ncbi:hypothetical protein JYU34_016222, partial [Plutella xylostella]